MPRDDATAAAGRSAPRVRVRSAADLVGAVWLLGLAAFALWAGRGLEGGTLRSMGPAMVPRSIALAIGAAGLLLLALSLLKDGPGLGRWPLRGPIVVTIAILAFALTIRTVGLALAGPLVVIVGGSASPESRPRELVVFGLVLTALCIGLFKYLLSLPIPVLIIPGVVTL